MSCGLGGGERVMAIGHLAAGTTQATPSEPGASASRTPRCRRSCPVGRAITLVPIHQRSLIMLSTLLWKYESTMSQRVATHRWMFS